MATADTEEGGLNEAGFLHQLLVAKIKIKLGVAEAGEQGVLVGAHRLELMFG